MLNFLRSKSSTGETVLRSGMPTRSLRAPRKSSSLGELHEHGGQRQSNEHLMKGLDIGMLYGISMVPVSSVNMRNKILIVCVGKELKLARLESKMVHFRRSMLLYFPSITKTIPMYVQTSTSKWWYILRKRINSRRNCLAEKIPKMTSLIKIVTAHNHT